MVLLNEFSWKFKFCESTFCCGFGITLSTWNYAPFITSQCYIAKIVFRSKILPFVCHKYCIALSFSPIFTCGKNDSGWLYGVVHIVHIVTTWSGPYSPYSNYMEWSEYNIKYYYMERIFIFYLYCFIFFNEKAPAARGRAQ